MITDDIRTRLYDRKTLGLTQLKDGILDYLDGGIRSAVARMYSTDGAFGTQVQVTATVVANNRVDIAKAAAFSATDGIGSMIGAGAADSRLQAVKIPPSAGTVFHVGLRSVTVESGTERNPQTGEVEYSSLKEEIGYVAEANSVAVNGAGLRITVDSLTEAGYDHSGRKVRVWLKPKQSGSLIGPQSIDPAAAIETGTIAYVSAHNVVDTVGQLGQSAPSTDPSDYVVMLVGPIVSRQAARDLTAEAGTVFLADVTSVASGSPITTISHTGQSVFSDVMSVLQDFIEIVGVHPKVRVKAFAGEDEVPQISVMGTDGVTRKFTVDEDGDVACAGNLNVGGSEIVSITEVALGSVELGDDCSADTASLWADLILKKGLKAGGGTGHADLLLGDGSEATPGNKVRFDGSSCDLEVAASANGSANDLLVQRNDAVAATSAVVIRNAGAGSALGLQVQGDVTVGLAPDATGPSLGIASNVNTWAARNVSGGLELATNDATDRAVTITNAHGTGKANLAVEGKVTAGSDLEVSGASPRLVATVAAAPLVLKDQVMTAPTGIPLTSATEPGGTALGTSSQSILGAISEVQSISNNIRQGGVFSLNGLLATDQGSRVCRISAGAAWVEGKKYILAQADLTIPVSSTAYIYVSAAGVISQTATKATAFASDVLPLAVVTTNGSTITSIETIRAGVPRVTQKISVTVGKNAADNRLCDFATLGEAFRWLKQWQSQVAGAGRPEVELVIVGLVDCTAEVITVEPEHSGLLVRGARMADLSALADETGYQSAHGESRIVWGANDGGTRKLFKVTATGENVGSIRFRDLTFVYTDTAEAANRLFGHESTAQVLRLLEFEGCRFTYTGTYDLDTVVYCAASATIEMLRFVDCRVTKAAASTAAAIDIQGIVNDGRILGSRFGADAAAASGSMLYLAGDFTIDGCRFSNAFQGIRTAATLDRLVVDVCKFTGITSRGVWAGAGNVQFRGNTLLIVGGTNEVGGLRCDGGTPLFSDNRIDISGAAGSYARGIESVGGAGHRSRIRGNEINFGPSSSNANNAAIYNSNPGSAISANTISSSSVAGIKNIAANTAIGDNTVTGTAGTIDSTGNYCNVHDNITDAGTTVAGTGAVSDNNIQF